MNLLFKALRLVGLDVPAKVEAVKAAIELRIEEGKAEARQVAVNAAVIAAFGIVALLAVLGLATVGLVALYLWIASQYGPFAGLGAVAVVLALIGGACLAAVMVRSRSSQSRRIPMSKPARFPAAETSPPPAQATREPLPPPVRSSPEPNVDAARTQPSLDLSSLASDALTPLGLLLGRYLTTPTRHPVLNEALRHLRTQADAASEDPIAMASRTVRDGDRKSMIAVLAGAAFLGWVLTKYPAE